MVRLKVDRAYNPQIKSSFNSTMVRLKDGSHGWRSHLETLKFQFHNGSIKSIVRDHRLTTCVVFQFHNGSIKSEPADGVSRVSIPQWFD